MVLFTSSGFFPASVIAPGFGLCGGFSDGNLPITEVQAQACNNLIKQTAAAAGIECVPFFP